MSPGRKWIVVWLLLALVAFGQLPVRAREIVDMAGRRVTVPDAVTKVYGATPPATLMVYAVDPALVAGLNYPLTASEKRFMDPQVTGLPVVGGWFGQGRMANVETLMQVRPDLILIWQHDSAAVDQKIERALAPLGIPVAYIAMDSIEGYPAVFSFLGDLLGREERGRRLGQDARRRIESVAALRSAVPETDRVTVYYAEEADGLSTECHASVHAEVIALGGGENVHRCQIRAGYGRQRVSMEQVLAYDPQVIFSTDPLFSAKAGKDSRWQSIRAVRDGRIYPIPQFPFNWFDRPPSFMRLLGIQFLARKLYPDRFSWDPKSEVPRFYRLYLNVSLNREDVEALVRP